LKKNRYSDKYFNVSNKGLIAVCLVFVMALGAAALVGFVKAQSNMNMSSMVLHIHPHLNITLNGQPFTVPALIGIDQSLWKNHSLDQYQGMQGMSPLHTHDASGTIHVESSVKRNYTLGEFLNIWGGLDLGGKTVKATVDGKPVTDFRNHILKDGEQINLDIAGK
jgi:hypothetical protein